MSHSSGDSTKEHSRERMITLPPIRDIFREQLSSPSPRSSPRPSYLGGSAYPPFSNESRPRSSASNRGLSSSPDVRFGGRDSGWNSTASQRPAAPGLRPSLSYGASLPEVVSQRPIIEHRRSQESSLASMVVQPPLLPSGYHHSSATERHRYTRTQGGDDPSRPSAASSSAWTEHRRRDSMESAWSSHSSSSATSFQTMSNPPPSASNALQFQPLPHTHMTSRPASNANAQHPARGDYQSPFGVLIADADPRGPSASDPQRTAIIRTLRASGIQGSFQINFDDPSSSQNPPRYSCEYCGKGFARPSSLKIHINSHTGEKPFQCPHPDCGRRFSVHSNMRRHYRVHGGDAPKTGEVSGDDELADE